MTIEKIISRGYAFQLSHFSQIHFVELSRQSPRLMLSSNLAALRDCARALEAALHPAAQRQVAYNVNV